MTTALLLLSLNKKILLPLLRQVDQEYFLLHFNIVTHLLSLYNLDTTSTQPRHNLCATSVILGEARPDEAVQD